MNKFHLVSKFHPTGDQPAAIAQLVKNLKAGEKDQVLLGVTGSGKTFSISNVIAKTQRPALIISPNKTLCAQLYQEFKEFFPENAVHFFVSYYDYYQPEAYIPQTDTYIEKDSRINEEIDRLRHAAVQDLLTRNDVIVIASVSCIYNIGSPENYQKISLEIKQGQKMSRKDFLLHLISLQYQRNDVDFKPGVFRVRGDIVEVYLVTGEKTLKIEFSGDKIISKDCKIFPAKFWVAPQNKLDIALENIKSELRERSKELKKDKKLLEAQRLEQRTNYDLEMIKETGFCHGIENYSRHLEFRTAGERPFTLLDYYPDDFLVFIDESHQTIPQLHAMSVQDRMRKETLIEYGFRLPSAVDNRPLKFEEFEKIANQTIYVSATPGKYEMQKIKNQPRRLKGSGLRPEASENPKLLVEQLIRPTGLLEPSIEIRPTKDQIKNLIEEIKKRNKNKQRTLALTLTKRLAEALSEHLLEQDIKAQWLHAEVKTLERPKILKDLREGKYDVLVGINLLREGLDLPEVSLVAILDADKEGFLRNETTLIQTMGRAARHLEGHIILYADKTTGSITAAINEINRRRKIQENYNKIHDIIPRAIIKEVREWPFANKEKEVAAEFWAVRDKNLLEKEMKIAARNLDFERAAEIRDLIRKLKVKIT
ncbi:MAG: excinuclease ABC subunit UvrB [Candidatus Wildermuthbacteria bacterium]|nr:excinuclease ABC subunit UvrB [Candidatus Wildermuthbacteria bacterium]